MIKTYLEAREYLEYLIKPIPYKSVEERISSYDPLDRMRKILELLGNPERKFRSVQVSGTSGKGSTAYLLSHMLTHAGYKTGFTLSPHLMNITERFQINEVPITHEDFLSLVNELVPVVKQMKSLEIGEPTYFEALMALTFLYFAREKVDIAIVEVGLEGRYDGTNTLNPLLFILTNISLDHVEFLGDTEEKIAVEATAAIRDSQIVVSGVTQRSVIEITEKKCKEVGAQLLLLGRDFSSSNERINASGSEFIFNEKGNSSLSVQLSLVGEYQIMNASLAIAAVKKLATFGFPVSDECIQQSLESATFPGRFEKITTKNSKEMILDGAHNPAKMDALVTSLQKLYPGETFTVIFACKKNKDISQMLHYLSKVVHTLIVTQYYTTTEAAKNSSMTIPDVLQQVEKEGSFSSIFSAQTISGAIQVACEKVKENKTRIVITGSLYLVGEAKTYLSEQE